MKLIDKTRYDYVDNEILLLAAGDLYKIEGLKKSVLEFLHALKSTGLTMDDVVETYPEYLELFNFLLDNKLVIEDFRKSPLYAEYSRILHYFESYVNNPVYHLQELCKKKVLILGLGGTGSIIFQHLLHNGVKKFTLADYGKVDGTDLNRQYIYTKNSLNNFKIDEAKQYGLSIHKDVEISTFNIKIDSVSSLKPFTNSDYDLVINACDTPINIIDILNEFILSERYSLYDAGVGQTGGTYGPLIIPSKTLCLQCFIKNDYNTMSAEEQMVKRIKSKPPMGSFGPTNSIVASFASLQCLHYLAGIANVKHNIQYYINFDENVINNFSTSGTCECWK